MADLVHDAKRLQELQALPLERKILISQTRIIEWYQHYNGNVYISFSGGKDSTVLLHLVRSAFPDVRAVFSNTGLEYPEIQRFARSFDNVDIVTPSMRFDQVISTYGYPLIGKEVAEAIYYARRIKGNHSKVKECDFRRQDLNGERNHLMNTSGARNRRSVLSGELTNPKSANGSCQFNKKKYLPLARDVPVMISHYCCAKMKKQPLKIYQKKTHSYPFLGTLTEESRIRRQAWLRNGCNAFDTATPMSQPLSFWTEHDILSYIVQYDIEIAPVYGEIVGSDEYGNECAPIDLTGNISCNLKCSGCQRTGCIFCGFGFHFDKGETRFQRLAKTHPKQYEYCIGGGQWADNPFYDPAAPEYDGEWKNWNPNKIWVPSKEGLGFGKVFDMVNEIYGKDFYRYD